MMTPQLSLLFLLVCQTTESLNDKQVTLGQNVTLDCQINVSDVYWVFQKLTDSPALILRTFTSQSTIPLILDERFNDKYSSLTLSRLFINNITIDELGIYYCVKTTGSGPQLGNGTRLYINFTESVQDHNQTENKNQPQCEKTLKIDNRLTATSFLLNIVLIIAMTGLLIHKFKKSTKSRQHHHNFEPGQLEDFNSAQYSEIELPTYSREENPKRINGTYMLLQKPKPHPRVQHT